LENLRAAYFNNAVSGLAYATVTFFNTKGLIDTLLSLGITVRTIEYLGARAMKRVTLS
jgi:hypothetical protein